MLEVRKRSIGKRVEQSVTIHIDLDHRLSHKPVGSFEISPETVYLAPSKHLIDIFPQYKGKILK